MHTVHLCSTGLLPLCVAAGTWSTEASFKGASIAERRQVNYDYHLHLICFKDCNAEVY